MTALLIITAILLVASVLLAGILQLLRWMMGHRPTWRYWSRSMLLSVFLAPVYLFLVVPAALGWLAPGLIGTRGDEGFYAGPWIREDGTWLLQERRRGGVAIDPPANIRPIESYRRALQSADGLNLNAYLIPPEGVAAEFSVVLVHGLFRSGLELESIATMFRDLGAEVLMLELRDHGGSDRAIFTFGRDEALDVVAAADYLRSLGRERIVLFGISLGSAAVALATERLKDCVGVVLEAPMDDLHDTATRMLGGPQMDIPQPFRGVMLAAMEWRMGMALNEVKPKESLAKLAEDVPVLLIGGGRDRRMPPEVVQAIFDGLATREDLKEIWVRAKSGHGSVSADDPEEYRRRLAQFLSRVR